MLGQALRVTPAPSARASSCAPKQWPSTGTSCATACSSSFSSSAIQALPTSFTLALLPSTTMPLQSPARVGRSPRAAWNTTQGMPSARRKSIR